MKDTIVLIFSKNRALQLDLALNSLYKCCSDLHNVADTKVIYRVDSEHKDSYTILMKEHSAISFIQENNFHQDVLNALADKKFVLFAVDDTVFVQPFSLRQLTSALGRCDQAVGFSLRLSPKTTFCYPLNAYQAIPAMIEIEPGILSYNWTVSQHDFFYALEVSSSLYRTKDLSKILNGFPFANPNWLEQTLYYNLGNFVALKPRLLCGKKSLAFSLPLNKVQQVAPNRVGVKQDYSAEHLMNLYKQGFRLDPDRFFSVEPNGCHMEMDLW